MTAETPENNESKPTKSEQVKTSVEKAAEVADKATGTLEGAQNAISAVKWVAISFVCLTILLIGWAGYKIFYKPVVAVSDAAGTVVEAVGDGAGAVKDSASNMINRLIIPTSNQNRLNRLSDAAFSALNQMDETEPEGMRDRLFRRTNFGGSDGKICKMSLDFGNGSLGVYAAADNEAHEKSKALGANTDRLVRFVIRVPDDDVEFNSSFDEETENWVMKWKKTTVKKSASDAVAEARILDILNAVPGNCGGE